MAEEETKRVGLAAGETDDAPKVWDTHSPDYDEHAHMVAIIQAGGAVLYKGNHLTRVENLPSRATLAKGNSAAEAKVRGDLQAQMDALQAQLDSLRPSKPLRGADESDSPNKGDQPLTGAAAEARAVQTREHTTQPDPLTASVPAATKEDREEAQAAVEKEAKKSDKAAEKAEK